MADDNESIEKLEQDTSFEVERELVHGTLTSLDVSPMKVHSLPKSSKLKRGKRKLRQINEAASKKVAAILNVKPDDLEESDEGKEQIEEFIQKASDLDYLVSLMKEKLEVSCRREKIQILGQYGRLQTYFKYLFAWSGRKEKWPTTSCKERFCEPWTKKTCAKATSFMQHKRAIIFVQG